MVTCWASCRMHACWLCCMCPSEQGALGTVTMWHLGCYWAATAPGTCRLWVQHCTAGDVLVTEVRGCDSVHVCNGLASTRLPPMPALCGVKRWQAQAAGCPHGWCFYFVSAIPAQVIR